jgi:multiple sugar transport system permease protein
LILVYVTFTMPFTLWMLQGYIAAIPRDLEEAGEMDGAGRWRVLRSIVFPLLAPGLVATAMFTFVSAWNEFFLALVLIQSPELYTLPITLRSFLGAEGQTQLGPLTAGAVIATIPSLIIFSLLQKRLTGSTLAGAVKG